MAATCEKVENGFRLASEQFEAVVSFAGPVVGVTHLAHRGDVARQKVSVKELPITLRLATDAQRIDIISWNGHAGSGNPLPPEDDWGYQLKLHEIPPGGGGTQRLTDLPIGPPWYTDNVYPGYFWYRTMVMAPKEWEGKPVVFVLGGCDRYDWRAYWVYLNGKRIGQSSHDNTYLGPWHEVPRYVLKPGDAEYAQIKFGQANQLSVQARGLDRSTPEMNRLDLERYSGQSMLVDQYVAGGEPTRDVTGFRVADQNATVADGVASVELVMTHPLEPISITAKYWLNPGDSALHKSIVVHNEGNDTITLLEADVLNLKFDKLQTTAGGQGWPVRIGEDWFAGVAHPAGVARYDQNGVRLQVLPGAVLDPTHSHDYVSKTAVVGVGNGRRAFSDYLQAHGRRKVQFLNMYSLYGLCEIATGLYTKVELTEPLVMNSVKQLRDLQAREIRFDFYCIDTGWNDPLGNLKTFHPANFPKGPESALKAVRDLGMKPLLWMSPAAGPAVFRAGLDNPLVPYGGESNNGTWGFCLAGEKWRTMLREAMLHHVKNNGVRGFKLDEVTFYCGRTSHGHMANKYGIEAQMDAFIDTLDAVKKECPDLLLMLYWRFMSPWWLLHTDTIYERGLLMEGSTPSPLPSRLIRQSVTTSLDQGHDYNWDRMPLIGQDSLGVWLSNTRWASWMGAEGWRDAWIMDFIRGNMMHQLWGDLSFLNGEDLEFMETIARWTKANSELLPNPKRILGSPWRSEAYGYACCKADRGVIAIHNASFAATTVNLRLDETVGLPPAVAGKSYEVRWVYKGGSVKVKQKQTVPAGGLLEVPLGSFEVSMADILPAGADATSQPAETVPALAGATRVSARFIQTAYAQLDWASPDDQKWLARVVNGRTAPTLNVDALAVGPERSDERDRDIVREKLSAVVATPVGKSASKLLVIPRTDRDGIAWHHLAPFLIQTVTATAGGKQLTVKTTPTRVHEEAGGWSWMLHEFDVPPGVGEVAITIEMVHPKSVSIATGVWHSDV
jgi:hypothetical protein